MEVVRKYVDASSLLPIMSLPENFRNRKLEVIVLPAEETQTMKRNVDIKGMVESLVGAIPPIDMSLSELREERLKKYEDID